MPYTLIRFPDGFKVMTTATGEFHSLHPLPYETAVRQMKALHIHTGEGKPTHRERVLKRLGDVGHGLQSLSFHSGVPLDILQEVYNRGIGAYSNTNSRYGVSPSVRLKGSYKKGVDAPANMKLSKEQWAMARVYSFLDNNPKHDQDLHRLLR